MYACVQANCSRTGCVCSCGSVTVWTHWDRFGQPAAGIRWTVTTAAALMDSSSAPITAARPPAFGAPGPVGRRAAFPVGRAKGPDTGEEKKLTNTCLYLLLYYNPFHFCSLIENCNSHPLCEIYFFFNEKYTVEYARNTNMLFSAAFVCQVSGLRHRRNRLPV